MKKMLFLFVFWVLLAENLFSQPYAPHTVHQKSSHPRIVLVHPTAYNLKIFVNLMEKKLVQLNQPEIVGLYYEKEVYEYGDAENYLKHNKINYIHLQRVSGDLTSVNLFQKNGCSDQFYKIFKNSDGMLFFGGPDIPPVVYGQKTNLLTSITDSYRHFFECSLLFHLLGGSQNPVVKPFLDERSEYVIYGICLGMQTMNVATGGTLYQDIPTEVYGLTCVEDILKLSADQQHGNYNRNLWEDDDISWGKFHSIKFVANNTLTRLIKISDKDTPQVSSSHHQAIRVLGQGWEAAALSMDGKVTEAITHTKYKNVVGVQFHPERMDLYDPEIMVRVRHEDAAKISFAQLLTPQSTAFHKAFWQHFSELF